MPMNPTLSALRAADPARIRAAVLFAAAARTDLDIDPGARLRCLAAAQALTDALPAEALKTIPHHRSIEPTDPASLVRAALTVLGSLPLEQFAAPDVGDAAEHGLHALRWLP